MAKIRSEKPILSVVVPLYNESEVINRFNRELNKYIRLAVGAKYEIIYVSDGSTDGTNKKIQAIINNNTKVKLITLSRNFGKENSLTAGLEMAKGNAIIMLDGDGQHPPSYIPKFYKLWLEGNRAVVGKRKNNAELGFIKSKTSMLFHKLINFVSDDQLIYGSTDYRLIDADVKDAILKLPESGRVMRTLIDWVGYTPKYVEFDVAKRYDGKSSFTNRTLIKHAMNSFTSLTPKPLYFVGYLGLIITFCSFILGTAVFVEQLVLDDPLNWNFTGTAMLAILILFLVGLLLIAQGILSIYISHMHNQTLRRPLYVIDYQQSVGIDKN